MKRKIRKLLFQMKYLEEDLEESKVIYDKAKIDFENQIRQLHYDLNIHDDAIDGKRGKEGVDLNSQPRDQLEEPLHKNKTHPPWAKKLFREIVKETHPDHFHKGMRESRKKKLIELYEKIVEKYNQNSYADLIDEAINLGIDIGDISKHHVTVTKVRIKELSAKISLIKNSVYWQWAHANEDQKLSILKKFVELKNWTASKASRSNPRSGNRKHPGKSISWVRKKFKNVQDIPSCDEGEE